MPFGEFDTREIRCPLGLADVNSDGVAEWICLKSKPVKYRLKPEKRIYVYKFNQANNKIEILWEGPDINLKDYLVDFDGKVYFGDLDGNGIQEIILIGWRFGTDRQHPPVPVYRQSDRRWIPDWALAHTRQA